MRRDPRLEIITEALQQLIPGATPAFLTVEVKETLPGTDERRNTWTGTPGAVAERVFTRLYGRPNTPTWASPLQQAEDAKRRRDLVGEVGALMAAGAELESAPWYPVRSGDLVHVHYEATPTPTLPAYGETYVIGDVGGALKSMQLISHSFPDSAGDPDEFGVGSCAVEAADDPIYELWFEGGPHMLTIVRDGQVVHDGPARGRGQAATRILFEAERHAATMREVQRYLERGEPELALARLKSGKPLPPCGAPGFTAEQADCARPRGHRGACSPDADYVEPSHECPKLPEQLHAVVTVGAKVTDVSIEGLYEERDAAVDHASGFVTYSEELTGRYVTTMPHGGTVVQLPTAKDVHGVQLAVVVPLPVLPDPREADWRDQEGRDACAEYDPDYGKDLDDEDDYDDRDGDE